MKYKYLFGPVPSRRLGFSLGVDLMPHKTCTLDCLYCECGKTNNLTIERKDYTPADKIKLELYDFLSQNNAIDFITFSGSGEPTLHSGIGEIIDFIKSKFPKYSIALLTNGTLSDVFKEIIDVDILKISIDAARPKTFININRPHQQLDLYRIIEEIILQKKNFKGKLWIEIFLVPGLNDDIKEIEEIKKILDILKPDKIQLNTLDRPGTEISLLPMEQKSMEKIASFLFDAEIIKKFDKKCKKSNLKKINIDEQILSSIKRRPCTISDIAKIMKKDENEIQIILDILLKQDIVKIINMRRGNFYTIK